MRRARTVGLLLLGVAVGCSAVDAIKKGTSKATSDINKATGTAKENFEHPKAPPDADKACSKFQLAAVSYDEEAAFGGAVAVNLAQGGLEIDPIEGKIEPDSKKKPIEYAVKPGDRFDALTYLNTVGRNLGAQSPRPEVEWKFAVLTDDKTINAVSAPAGYVFVTKALLSKVQNEDQLAGVLAHEIGHVALRHALKRYSDSKYWLCVGTFLGKKVTDTAKSGANQFANALPKGGISPDSPLGKTFGGFIEGTATKVDLNDPSNLDALTDLVDRVVRPLLELGYSHDDEYAADEVAASLLRSAGYSTAEYGKFLTSLPNGGAFKNHPTGQDRVLHLKAFIEKQQQDDPFFAPAPDHPPIALSEKLKPLL
ncbi:MAG: M48 family metallopeptidase [Myxococcaceae bacterium]